MTTINERYADAIMNTFGAPKRVLARGSGCYVWDVDGNRYLDLLAGIAVNSLGHAHPAVVETITAQASTLGHVSNFFATEPQVLLAERLLALLGAGDGRVFFTSSGTEANEAALKATRRTGRTKLVAAEGSFHGRTMGALALTAKPAYREPFEPLPGDVEFVPYGDVAALRAAVDSDTAAVVLEPIQGEAGVVVPPDGYLVAAREIADASGALLWLDEVQTGIGRTGDWFAYQSPHSCPDGIDASPADASAAVRPDLVTVAKGLAGGFPIGACVGLGEAGALLGPGQHGTTFGGNPLAAATALTVLDVIEKDSLLEQVRRVGEVVADALAGMHGVRSVRGRGLLLAADLAPGSSTQVAAAALDGGLIVNNCTPDALRLVPPLILDDEQVQEAAPVLAAAIDSAASASRQAS
ncbi:MAG: acetylornithine transaminase [Nocardioidaceae bacterium]